MSDEEGAMTEDDDEIKDRVMRHARDTIPISYAPATEGEAEALTFGELSRVSKARAKRWHGGTEWSLSDWAVALTGELGEACNVIKKLKRNVSDWIRSLTGRRRFKVSDDGHLILQVEESRRWGQYGNDVTHEWRDATVGDVTTHKITAQTADHMVQP